MSDSSVTPWTVAHQTSLSTAFPRQEYWRGLPFPPPVDLLHPGIELRLLCWQVDSLPLSHLGSLLSLLLDCKPHEDLFVGIISGLAHCRMVRQREDTVPSTVPGIEKTHNKYLLNS